MRRSTHKRAQPAHSICYDLHAVERFRDVTLHLVQQFKRVVTIFVLGGGVSLETKKILACLVPTCVKYLKSHATGSPLLRRVEY